MEEKKLTEHESLHLIQQMIQVAREDHRENGEGWLIWGWMLFIASLSSAILSMMEVKGVISWIWFGALGVGIILYVVLHVMNKRDKNVKTYVQELLDRLGTGFFVSLFVIIIANFITRSISSFGYYYILYGFWMFIHGSAIRFRPLILAAWLNWAAAIAIFILHDQFTWVMIISTVAVLLGYLVPGYMLRAEYRKKMKV